jgi:hypothetical protein
VNGKEVGVSGAGLLLRQSELRVEDTPALDELISLLRLERVVPRDVSELREVARRVGLEWAIDFDCAAADPEVADLTELEAAVSSEDAFEALSKTASFRAGDWQSVIDVLFRFTRAKPTRWRETARALKEILRSVPESTKCLEGQGKGSVGEQLRWLSIDDSRRGSRAGSLDPTRPNFVVAGREFHGWGGGPLVTALGSDDMEGPRSHLLAAPKPDFNQCLRMVCAGGDAFAAFTGETRDLSMLAVAAQFGAVRCAQYLLMSGAKVGTTEVEAAFRGGNAEMMRLLWDALPSAEPFKIALEAVKSWNVAGFRWLLDRKMGVLSPSELVRLFEATCSSGSYSCGSSVLGLSSSAAAHLRGLQPVGLVWSVLCGGVELLKSGRDVSFIPENSMAAGYSVPLREWLPEATEVRLVTKGEGRSTASVNLFISASKGRTKTLTFVETENGNSICGGYLDAAWVEGGPSHDSGRASFIFTLKNQLGVLPTRFVQKRDEHATYMRRDDRFYFGRTEGLIVWKSDAWLNCGQTYDTPSQGVALFSGNTGGMFRAARWELWQVD